MLGEADDLFQGRHSKNGQSLRGKMVGLGDSPQPLPPPGAHARRNGTKCANMRNMLAPTTGNWNGIFKITFEPRLLTQPKQLEAIREAGWGERQLWQTLYNTRYERNKWIIRIKYGFSLIWCWMEEILSAVFMVAIWWRGEAITKCSWLIFINHFMLRLSNKAAMEGRGGRMRRVGRTDDGLIEFGSRKRFSTSIHAFDNSTV